MTSKQGPRRRAVLWLLVALLLALSSVPADRMVVCLCGDGGIEFGFGRNAEPACHGDPADREHPSAPDLNQGLHREPCAHVTVDRPAMPRPAGTTCSPPTCPPAAVAVLTLAPQPAPPPARPTGAPPPDPLLLRRCVVLLI